MTLAPARIRLALAAAITTMGIALSPGAACAPTATAAHPVHAVAADHPEPARAAQDYVLFCRGCHGANAEGIPGRVPPLAHMIARFMRTAPGREYILRVPGVAASALPDDRIAAVLNWLAVTFDREDVTRDVRPVTTEEVAALRHVPLADAAAARRKVIAELAGAAQAVSQRH